MPLFVVLEDLVTKLPNSNELCSLPLQCCSKQESDSFAKKLLHTEIPSLIQFVNDSDEKLCNITTTKGETALSIAIYRNSIPLCKALIEKGCDVHREAKFPPFYIKLSPLSYAVTQGNMELVKLLLQYGCTPAVKDELGRSAVMCAICCGHTDILKLFLEKGCDPNTRISDTLFTILHEACYRGYTDAVMALLEAGADPNLIEYNDRTTPAFHTNKSSIQKLLFKYGSNINWRSRSGETILHSAVYLGNTELVEFLLQNGAIMNYSQTIITYNRNNMASNIQTKDLFQLAFSEEHWNICLILVQHGFQLDINSEKNQCILSKLISLGRTELLTVLFIDSQYKKCNHQLPDIWFNSNKELKYIVNDTISKVQSLMGICRNQIRHSLTSSFPNQSIFYKLEQLHCVPRKLIDYILFK